MDVHILDSCRLNGEIPAAGRCVGGDALFPESEGSGKPPKNSKSWLYLLSLKHQGDSEGFRKCILVCTSVHM